MTGEIEMQQPTERIAYSVKEVALLLGISEWSVREAIRCGRLGSIRVGTRILIPCQALDRFLGISTDTDEIPDSPSPDST